MTKDEACSSVMGAISMAIKDSTLQQGFEIICKENTELEEKNKELSNRLCNITNELLNNWCRNAEDYCPHLFKLQKENKELKEVHESDKRSLHLIAEKGAELEEENAKLKAYNEKLLNGDIEKHNKIVELQKACEETQELLDKQIEATYKVVEENAELKEKLLQEREIYWGKGFECAKEKYEEQLIYVKTIIQDLLNNSDEYARQRAIDFLKGSENE